MVRVNRRIADLERRIAEQRERRNGDTFASAEILYLLEGTLRAMEARKAGLERVVAAEADWCG
jgi:hypothetical protein